MTTDAERECYYRLVRRHAGAGSVIEVGAWLGASTAYIAAALRDVGGGKVTVFDNFEAASDHRAKVNSFLKRNGLGPSNIAPAGREAFTHYLGPLMKFVETRVGNLDNSPWEGPPVSVLVCDAPKDLFHVSAVLAKFAGCMEAGAVMAWQDFCHFPSFAIPAALYILRDHLGFEEAITPGSTVVLSVTSPWTRGDVSVERLDFANWSADEIDAAWEYWRPNIPKEKQALFDCGAVLFKFTCGHVAAAAETLKRISEQAIDEIYPKWLELARQRDFERRFWPLLALLGRYTTQR